MTEISDVVSLFNASVSLVEEAVIMLAGKRVLLEHVKEVVSVIGGLGVADQVKHYSVEEKVLQLNFVAHALRTQTVKYLEQLNNDMGEVNVVSHASRLLDSACNTLCSIRQIVADEANRQAN